jgi:hypothetical protein
MNILRNRPTARNPKTLARFRRETWWQITFPMIVVVLVLLGGVGGLFFWRGAGGVSVVANYSMILMIIPLLVVGLIAFGVVIGLIYLVMEAIRLIPPYTYVAHKATFGVRDRVASIANRITNFVIGIRSFLDGIVHYLKERGFVPDIPQDAAPGDAGRQS